MAYEHKDMSGNLFRNHKKEGNQPDYRGEVKIRGELLQVSAWVKTKNNSDEKYFSFAFSEPYQSGGANQAASAPSGEETQGFYDSPAGDDDSSVPF